MKLFKNRIVLSLVFFALGGGLSYFVSDYIRLKGQTKISATESKLSKTSSHIIKPTDPFAKMDQIQDQMKKSMNRVFSSGSFGSRFFDDDLFSSSFKTNQIEIDQYEDDHYKYIEVLAEGVDQDSININISNGIVSISGQIKKENKSSGSNHHSMSSFVSSFSQSFNIPDRVKEDGAQIDTDKNKIIIKFPKEKISV